jgi:hypothetical protein
MKRRRENNFFSVVRYQWEGVGTRKGEITVYMWMCFVFIYENRRMKPVEIVLRGGGKSRMIEGIYLTKIYFKHIYKYHNVSPCTTIIG